jgi:hypothetical protein
LLSGKAAKSANRFDLLLAKNRQNHKRIYQSNLFRILTAEMKYEAARRLLFH